MLAPPPVPAAPAAAPREPHVWVGASKLESELRAWVADKADWASLKNVNKAVGDVLGPVGGGTKLKYGGKSVWHMSVGKRGRNDGVTIFYTADPDTDTVTIAAIGQHTRKDDNQYALGWAAPGWEGGNPVVL